MGAARKVMIIRHAEKPDEGCADHGVTVEGVHDRHELTIRGWQRAGALVRFFASPEVNGVDASLSVPRSLFASCATIGSPSLRAQHTITPLAAMLRLAINHQYADGDEERLAVTVVTARSPVLISWHHNHIPSLARKIAGATLDCPDCWPDERFDVVWVLDCPPDSAEWTFSQVPQRLLSGDCDDVI